MPPTHLLNGRQAADKILRQLKTNIGRQSITLATIQVGRRFDSSLYIKLKTTAANKVGIITEPHALPSSISQKKLLALIAKLNQQPDIHGLLLQLPLPRHLNTDIITQSISPTKDVDGFHPQSKITPPTIAAVLHLIKMAKPRSSSKIVILGRPSVFTTHLQDRLSSRSNLVTILPATHKISPITKKADIIITALGRGPRLTAHDIKTGAIIIDVGIRQFKGRTIGDVHPSVMTKAKAVSPVPGGVGPMTVAYLLYNTYQLARQQARLSKK